VGEEVRGESSSPASERRWMGAEWISLARARVCRALLGAWAERQSWISGRLDGGFACWFAAFWATARMAASNWKMHWLEAAAVDSYYSAPRRRTVDCSRYVSTLYAFASAFASLLICKPRVLDGLWTHDCLQVQLSCGNSTQLGARDMDLDLTGRERDQRIPAFTLSSQAATITMPIPSV
jgi:hypothetical protein